MPIVRIQGRLLYAAHVPRCAGRALAACLEARFGQLALSDPGFRTRDPKENWSKISPEHLPAAALERLFPPDFFAARFALVRHPVDRLTSMFRHHRDIEGTIRPGTGFSHWLGLLEERRSSVPYYLDGHPRPMTYFVPEKAQIFRLEDGPMPLMVFLNSWAGRREKGPRRLERLNTYAGAAAARGMTPTRVTPTETDIALIERLYAEDFRRFGYDPAAHGLTEEKTP